MGLKLDESFTFIIKKFALGQFTILLEGSPQSSVICVIRKSLDEQFCLTSVLRIDLSFCNWYLLFRRFFLLLLITTVARRARIVVGTILFLHFGIRFGFFVRA